jgi:hypothetical protein
MTLRFWLPKDAQAKSRKHWIVTKRGGGGAGRVRTTVLFRLEPSSVFTMETSAVWKEWMQQEGGQISPYNKNWAAGPKMTNQGCWEANHRASFIRGTIFRSRLVYNHA